MSLRASQPVAAFPRNFTYSNKFLNEAVSEQPPVSHIDPTSIRFARGRNHSRTHEWYEAVQTERERRRSSKTSSESSSRRGSADVIDASTISAHHNLHAVPIDDGIPPNPILYLPPLLSPLPETPADYHPLKDRENDIGHRHNHLDIQIHVEEVPDIKSSMPEGIEQVDVLRDFSTRLPSIDPASLALHQALHHFAPLTDAYASTPYDQAFNWSSLSLPNSTERDWYCVVFRSRRNPGSASLSLYKADREAHEEAVKNGGLIMYWYGVPDSTGTNLATCIWQSRGHAVKAISGPKHMSAMKQTVGAYEFYTLERWILSTDGGRRSAVKLRPWEGGEVGW